VLIDLNGNVYLQDKYGKYIKSISPSGVVRTLPVELLATFEEESGLMGQFISIPEGVFMDPSGFVYLLGYSDEHIFKIDPMGVVHKIDTGTVSPKKKLESISGQHLIDQFRLPRSICFDTAGNVYITNRIEHNIIKISKPGFIKVLAGSGYPGFADTTGVEARFSFPSGIAVDYSGNIFVADAWNHRIRRVDTEGNVSTYAGSGVAGYIDGPAEFSKFNLPVGVSADKNGNVVVADFGNNLIRLISRSGMVNNFPGIKVKASTPVYAKRDEQPKTISEEPVVKKTSLDQLIKELAGMQKEKDSLRLAIKLVKEQKQLDSLQLALEASAEEKNEKGVNTNEDDAMRIQEEINRKAKEIARTQKEKDSLMFVRKMNKRLMEEEEQKALEIAKKQMEIDSLKKANAMERVQMNSIRDKMSKESIKNLSVDDSVRLAKETSRLKQQEEMIQEMIRSTKMQREKDSLWIAAELKEVKNREEALRITIENSQKQRTADSLKFAMELSKKQREIDSLKNEITIASHKAIKDTLEFKKELVVRNKQNDSLIVVYRSKKRKRENDSLLISMQNIKKQRETDSLKLVHETYKRNRESDSLRLVHENIRKLREEDSLKNMYLITRKNREKDSLEHIWAAKRLQAEADSLRMVIELEKMKRERDSLSMVSQIVIQSQNEDSTLLAYKQPSENIQKKEPSSSLTVNQNKYSEEKEPLQVPEPVEKEPIDNKNLANNKDSSSTSPLQEKDEKVIISDTLKKEIQPVVVKEEDESSKNSIDNKKELQPEVVKKEDESHKNSMDTKKEIQPEVVKEEDESLKSISDKFNLNLQKVNPNVTFYLDENHFISTIIELKDTIVLKMVDKFGRKMPYRVLMLIDGENKIYEETTDDGTANFAAEIKEGGRVVFRKISE